MGKAENQPRLCDSTKTIGGVRIRHYWYCSYSLRGDKLKFEYFINFQTPYFVHDKIMNTVQQQLEDAMYKARKELTKLALQSEIDMLKRVGNAFQKSFW